MSPMDQTIPKTWKEIPPKDLETFLRHSADYVRGGYANGTLYCWRDRQTRDAFAFLTREGKAFIDPQVLP